MRFVYLKWERHRGCSSPSRRPGDGYERDGDGRADTGRYEPASRAHAALGRATTFPRTRIGGAGLADMRCRGAVPTLSRHKGTSRGHHVRAFARHLGGDWPGIRALPLRNGSPCGPFRSPGQRVRQVIPKLVVATARRSVEDGLQCLLQPVARACVHCAGERCHG